MKLLGYLGCLTLRLPVVAEVETDEFEIAGAPAVLDLEVVVAEGETAGVLVYLLAVGLAFADFAAVVGVAFVAIAAEVGGAAAVEGSAALAAVVAADPEVDNAAAVVDYTAAWRSAAVCFLFQHAPGQPSAAIFLYAWH